jgi:hypothetical protein
MSLNVTLASNAFNPPTQPGVPGQTVTFHNNRSSDVTITLDASFYSQSSLHLGKNGGYKNVQIRSNASGTGPFSAPQVSVAQTTVTGDIIITTPQPHPLPGR